ncbi:hypothetical protein WIS52_22485 [Pseudonocardia nematodicida]|uniref:Uncharacterized protein n=1 Tax=Pseudonocardia nematodicida TaxID=1206997 RepID=A0ABV1KFK4_9PSEU
MTTYAHDPARSAIVATWPTGDGHLAQQVARVPRNASDELARRTAAALTTFSARLWESYGELTAHEIRPFRLIEAVRHPGLPAGGMQSITGDDRAEAAYLVGRILARAPGRAFADAVLAEVRTEIDAVLDADDGALRGRSRQAVVHPRPDAPADQVITAHSLLYDDPLGPRALLTEVEPHAAGLALLRWLRAAAEHVAGLVGHSVDDVVALAEAIGHEDLAVARYVLRDRDATDELTVLEMLQEAVLAGRGRLLVCPDADGPAVGSDEHRHRVAGTVLDPREPGASLVGGLIRGLQGCFHVYVDEIRSRERADTDIANPGSEPDDELRARFDDEVRFAVRTSGSDPGGRS